MPVISQAPKQTEIKGIIFYHPRVLVHSKDELFFPRPTLVIQLLHPALMQGNRLQLEKWQAPWTNVHTGGGEATKRMQMCK